MIQIDMDMPKTCDDCPFHIYHSVRDYVCVATPLFYPMNLANYKGGRKEFCPLKEVPQEPILDKIRAEIKHFMFEINPSSSESDYACNYILDILDKYKAESEEKEMSKAKKCDKCGAFYEPYRTNIIVITKDSLSSDGLDLCPDCMDTFKKWLKNDVQMILFSGSENTSECQEVRNKE